MVGVPDHISFPVHHAVCPRNGREDFLIGRILDFAVYCHTLVGRHPIDVHVPLRNQSKNGRTEFKFPDKQDLLKFT